MVENLPLSTLALAISYDKEQSVWLNPRLLLLILVPLGMVETVSGYEDDPSVSLLRS